MVCCGVSSDLIYKILQCAQREGLETGYLYELLFQEDALKEAKTEEEQGEAKALISE